MVIITTIAATTTIIIKNLHKFNLNLNLNLNLVQAWQHGSYYRLIGL